jgi:hypothetical protein
MRCYRCLVRIYSVETFVYDCVCVSACVCVDVCVDMCVFVCVSDDDDVCMCVVLCVRGRKIGRASLLIYRLYMCLCLYTVGA